jgi:hypothetical protein
MAGRGVGGDIVEISKLAVAVLPQHRETIFFLLNTPIITVPILIIIAT